MKELCIFNVKQRFNNFSTIIINVVIAILITVVFNFDRLFINNEKRIIGFDETTVYLFDEVNDSERIRYQLDNNSSDGCILHYDESFKLKCEKELNEKERQEIEKTLSEAIENQYLQNADLLTKEHINQLKEMKKINIEYKIKNIDNSSFILSILYFLLNFLGPMISNDILNDKYSRHYEMLVSCIGKKEYFYSKIISCYIEVLIQIILIIIFIVINVFIRWNNDSFKMLESDVIYNNSFFVIEANVIFSIIISVLTVQFLLLLVTTTSKNHQHANQKQTLFYLLLMIMYYIVLTDNILITKILSYIPLINVLTIPVYLKKINRNQRNILLIYQSIQLIVTIYISRYMCTKEI